MARLKPCPSWKVFPTFFSPLIRLRVAPLKLCRSWRVLPNLFSPTHPASRGMADAVTFVEVANAPSLLFWRALIAPCGRRWSAALSLGRPRLLGSVSPRPSSLFRIVPCGSLFPR
jgi:hypothetical protein